MSDHSRQIGIVWEERFPDMRPGVLYFECDRLSAHLTKESCHQNWNAAHEKVTDETPLRLLKCRSCPKGRALHTDCDASLTWQDVRSGSECVRCGRRDLRLIGGTTCVSCWNRSVKGALVSTPGETFLARGSFYIHTASGWRAKTVNQPGINLTPITKVKRSHGPSARLTALNFTICSRVNQSGTPE